MALVAAVGGCVVPGGRVGGRVVHVIDDDDDDDEAEITIKIMRAPLRSRSPRRAAAGAVRDGRPPQRAAAGAVRDRRDPLSRQEMEMEQGRPGHARAPGTRRRSHPNPGAHPDTVQENRQRMDAAAHWWPRLNDCWETLAANQAPRGWLRRAQPVHPVPAPTWNV